MAPNTDLPPSWSFMGVCRVEGAYLVLTAAAWSSPCDGNCNFGDLHARKAESRLPAKSLCDFVEPGWSVTGDSCRRESAVHSHSGLPLQSVFQDGWELHPPATWSQLPGGDFPWYPGEQKDVCQPFPVFKLLTGTACVELLQWLGDSRGQPGKGFFCFPVLVFKVGTGIPVSFVNTCMWMQSSIFSWFFCSLGSITSKVTHWWGNIKLFSKLTSLLISLASHGPEQSLVSTC